MHYFRKISLLLAVLAVGLMSAPASQAQSVGSCEQAIGEAYLDINNVRARILNNGNLFWRGSPHVYNIPKGGPSNAIFASGIWMGGLVNGQLRLAGSTYGPFEFWAGPLNDDGTAPADCSVYDRVWKVSKEDVTDYEEGGVATPDLADWPTGLGAPTLDANGDMIDLTDQPLASRVDRKVNLGAGERPAILGDQMLWWIMNDRGNQHNRTDTPPMGVEVHGSAFAFNNPGAIGNTTFYKYRIRYKGSVPLEETYMGLFSDPDLGNYQDDYVGSDTTLGLGFVYNSDNDDEGGEGYGEAPPAAGYDFFQGPLVDSNGIDDDKDGEVDEENERLKMTAFAFYNNGGGVQGDPGNGADMYNYMKGRWKDGQSFTLGGNGLGFSNIPTSFMFPGNPPEFWSEFDSDGQGSIISPADRRFVMASGPFTIRPNDEQTLVFGIVTSFGKDNLDSVQQMKADDALAQAAFDIDFQLPSPPAGPRVTTTVDNGSVLIEWGNTPTDNNYLNSYTVVDPFADPSDNDYVFEGYNVYQFANSSDQEGKLIAVYDVPNGITQVIEGSELTYVSARGTDRGVQNYHQVQGLTNYRDYEFGVQAYAYNAISGPKVYAGPITRFTVTPQASDVIVSEEAVIAAASASDFQGEASESNIGDGSVSVKVVNPAKVTGDSYAVNFYSYTVEGGKRSVYVSDPSSEPGDVDDLPTIGGVDALGKDATSVTTYDVMNTTKGLKVFDGSAAVDATGNAAPEGPDVLQYDGLSMSVGGAPLDIAAFLAVSNGAGPLDPPEMGTVAFNSNGFPALDYSADAVTGGYGDRPTSGQQTNGSTWAIATGRGAGQSPSYATFVSRALRQGWGDIVPYDWEIRFTQECYDSWRAAYDSGEVLVTSPTVDGCYGYDRFGMYDEYSLQYVPFEVWRTGIGSPDDPSDDVRLIVASLDWETNGWGIRDVDHPGSGANNDPQTDWNYWYLPLDMTPGEAGYKQWLQSHIDACYPYTDGCKSAAAGHSRETFARIVFMNWNGGDVAGGVYDADMPEAGTVFRINTTKPNQPGDSFTISTDGLAARARTEAENRAAIEEIGITPNPYKGVSSYEVSQLVDQVRFTNMPNQATIRIFTVAGSLVRTLEKNSASATFPWDLTTDEGLPIASGMYLIHVDTEWGEKVLKFGVVKKRIQLNTW